MNEPAWQARLVEARPRVVAALLRSLRDLETAEEAYQEACVRALKAWARVGPPKDPVAWLILVGRNAAIDGLRRAQRWQELDTLSEQGLKAADSDPEERILEGLEQVSFGDEMLRLFFVCCHPVLAPAEQIALALKVVAGMSVAEIARAFLVKAKTMEQRLTRAKKKLGDARVYYGPPGAGERARRLPMVTSMIYLLFSEGYSCSGGEAHLRAPLCDEAIRLARALLRVTPTEPEVMGLLALCLLQHSRCAARLDSSGAIIALESQNRDLWHAGRIAEGQVLVEKALLRRQPGPLQIQAAIAAVHCAAEHSQATDWPEIDRLYAALERIQPSPVVTLNRAVAIAKARGPEAALESLESVAEDLDGFFNFHGVRGGLFAELGRRELARSAWIRALQLARTSAEQRYIEQKLLSVSD